MDGYNYKGHHFPQDEMDEIMKRIGVRWTDKRKDRHIEEELRRIISAREEAARPKPQPVPKLPYQSKRKKLFVYEVAQHKKKGIPIQQRPCDRPPIQDYFE